MVQMKPVFVGRNQIARNSGKLLLLLLLTGSSLLWEACSAVRQSTPVASPTQTQSSKNRDIVLANATVGVSYRDVLSSTGAPTTPQFALMSGQLPPGLSLNVQTGAIAGDPTQSGTFTFQVRDGRGVSSFHTYQIEVLAASNAVTVQISPASVSVAPGASVQFSASVKNTSSTAVNWSASAGTISSAGVLKIPAVTSLKSITVTATSAVDTAAHATATAAIGSTSVFSIATASLPQGKQSVPYSASLTATGGVPPYQWSVISGGLPQGLQLNSATGVVGGTATVAGNFPVGIQSTDANAQTTQHSFALVISSSSGSGSNCGPPTYSCSRTDSATVQVPAQVPNVGNVTGAGTIVSDPDFGNPIVRITDWNTDPASPTNIRSYVTANSGSADENLWNLDSSMFIIQTLGTEAYPFTFDASSLQASRMYVAADPKHGGFKLTSAGMWSRVYANILYTNDSPGAVLNKYDFSDRTTPPSPQLFYDFTSSPNCLPAGFNVTWQSKGGVSAGDAVFGMGYSNTGVQGSGVYAAAYKVGSGCTVINTQTGQVWGDWGMKGTINIPDRWTIHNVKISKDGNYLIIATGGCLISSCSHGPYFWQIGTTNVSSCGDGLTGGQKCGGHWTEGYSHWMNNYDAGKYTLRPLSQPTSLSFVDSTVPTGVIDPLDQHASWNNADPADTLPFFLTYWSLTHPFPGPWYNEIVGVAPDGSRVWRFAHNFITGRSQIFSTQYGIGSVSQDGRFFIFSSDWMGTLGSQSGGASCTIGTDCRGDVFVVQLN